MGKRLSDTESLVREGINPPGPKIAPFGGNFAHAHGADDAVGKGNAGHFRRETGAGSEGFSGACAELKKE